jgi:hypothetical protein
VILSKAEIQLKFTHLYTFRPPMQPAVFRHQVYSKFCFETGYEEIDEIKYVIEIRIRNKPAATFLDPSLFGELI